MQPVMPSRTTSGRALERRASSLARANTRSSAFSRTAQVLIRMTSAAAGSSVRAVARLAEHAPASGLAVGDVHLAAVGLDVGERPRARSAAVASVRRRNCTRPFMADFLYHLPSPVSRTLLFRYSWTPRPGRFHPGEPAPFGFGVPSPRHDPHGIPALRRALPPPCGGCFASTIWRSTAWSSLSRSRSRSSSACSTSAARATSSPPFSSPWWPCCSPPSATGAWPRSTPAPGRPSPTSARISIPPLATSPAGAWSWTTCSIR